MQVAASFKKVAVASSVAVMLVLGGCATVEPPAPPVKQAPPETLESGLQRADDARTQGKPDDAVAILTTFAGRFPADKAPWLKMAQIRYDAHNYPETIVNAQEVLKRDPADQVASSLIVVSSLRLASKSLADLRAQNALDGTATKTQAQELTTILRDNLGESTLVPATKVPVAAPKRKASPAHKAAPARSPAGSGGGSADPFGSLR